MKKIIIIGMGCMFLWSCNKASEKSKVNSDIEHRVIPKEVENFDAISLNDGQKWIVNEEMKPGVLRGEQLVSTYIQNGKLDYQTLAKLVNEQNDQLIKNCTMSGASHDELHKWLHPHLEIVKTLQNEQNADKAAAIVLQLQHSYQQYHQYFI